jgi:hypothetical protein
VDNPKPSFNYLYGDISIASTIVIKMGIWNSIQGFGDKTHREKTSNPKESYFSRQPSDGFTKHFNHRYFRSTVSKE